MDNFDMSLGLDGLMGMIFVMVIMALLAWLVRTVVIKGIELQQTRVTSRAAAAHEQQYRELAQQAAAAESEMAGELRRLGTIEQRLTEIERMLREIDEPVPAR